MLKKKPRLRKPILDLASILLNTLLLKFVTISTGVSFNVLNYYYDDYYYDYNYYNRKFLAFKLAIITHWLF